MTRARLPCLLRAALAACLAVVTTMPPAMGHAHAGGDRPHEHAHADDHDGHRHAGETEHAAILAVGWSSAGAGRFAHLHFAWLGFEVTFAWPVGSSATGEGQPEHIVVRLLDSAAQNNGPVDVQSPLTAVSFVDFVHDAGHLAAPSLAGFLRALVASAPPTTLLCDAARHERSGVLLS